MTAPDGSRQDGSKDAPPQEKATKENATRAGSENPYSAPSAHGGGQSLHLWQRKLLEFFLKHRDRELTATDMLGGFLRRWLRAGVLLAAMVVLIYGLAAQSMHPAAITFLVGIVLGAVLGDMATIRRTLVLWPLYRHILDWDAIEQILAGKPVDPGDETHSG